MSNRQLRDLSKQVQEYEQLFSELQSKLDPEDSQLIQDLLSKVGYLCSDDLSFWQFTFSRSLASLYCRPILT